jgi:GxxExxY protein
MTDSIPDGSRRSDSQFEDGELTKRIIGCAMRVHSTLGCGFQEVVYRNSLGIELFKEGLNFLREYEMPIRYEGQIVGARRVDFLVEQRVSVELKAVVALEDIHLAQAKNYLEAYKLRVGLLINFGARSLEYKRIINSKAPMLPPNIPNLNNPLNRPRNPL